MAKKATKTGKDLERRVADAYRQMRAWKVEHDVPMAGHQIDVYVQMTGPDRFRHRIAVEAKDWQSPVGIDVVSNWAIVVDDLRRAGLVDEGVIVSALGFTKPAREAAAEHVRRGLPLRLLELADLDAMVAEAEAAGKSPIPVKGTSLQSAILDALYDRFESDPSSPRMTFGELYAAIGISPDDTAKMGEVSYELFSLKGKGWINYSSFEDGLSSKVEIIPEGIKATKDRRTSAPSESQCRDDSEGAATEAETPKPCPPTLEELIRIDPSCACLIQRDELLHTITERIVRAFETSHFVVLYGQPMVGKTEMLLRLRKVLDDKYVPLMVTGQGLKLSNELDNFDAFTFDLADQLTNQFRKWAKRRGLSSLPSPNLGDFDGRGRIAFDMHWNKLREIADKSQPLVIFDEIERLLDFSEKLDQRILTFLDYFVRNPDNGCFILAGSECIQFSENAQFSLLIADGEPHVRVGHYDDETVYTIFSRIQEYFTYEENVLQQFIALCDGHPRILKVMIETTLSMMSRLPDKQRVEEDDVDSILTTLMERICDFLWALRQRLSPEELTVVWLISQKMPGLPDKLEYSLDELVELADQQLPGSTVDYGDLIETGIVDLQKREWVEWKDWDNKLFRFRLGIFPLWVRRYRISLDEVRCW